MEEVIRHGLNVAEPTSWQTENALCLFEGMDVFLTAGTGSGKSTLVHSFILASKMAGKPCCAIVIEPTRALMDDQVSLMTTWMGRWVQNAILRKRMPESEVYEQLQFITTHLKQQQQRVVTYGKRPAIGAGSCCLLALKCLALRDSGLY